MSIGFTGTQRGMTEYQKNELTLFLSSHSEDVEAAFHHGDCIGADAEAVEIARRLDYRIICHPPDNPVKRAYTKWHDIFMVKPYLQRNREIVDACEILVVCPGEMEEQERSGTWSTFRYARRVNRKYYIIYPEAR